MTSTPTATTAASAASPPAWRTALTQDEIRELLRIRDARAWLSVATNWGVTAGAFAFVAAWPNPLTVVAAVCLIGTRQLGGAALMHEAAHRVLFRNRTLNDWVGNWLCAYPIWSDTDRYRPYHLQHHAHTGTAQDPDLGLILPFPVTRESLRRKLWRDISGRTGRKFARAAWARTFARWRTDPLARKAARGALISNAVLLGLLTAAGYPALYLLWVGAWLTTNTLVTRIRFIAEHALTPDQADPLRNTRTMLPAWWERLLIVPNRLNYHLEHHLLMTVPHYNLPRMHRLLRERGVLDHACVEHGYLRVLRRAGGRVTAAA